MQEARMMGIVYYPAKKSQSILIRMADFVRAITI